MEEPYDGSTLGRSEHPLQQYRSAKNLSDIELAHSSSAVVDSGYLTTSTDTTHVSSLSSTPQRLSSSGYGSTLHTVPEYSEVNITSPDPIKLTPVTENIRNICNFHITTPKDETYMPGAKRNVAATLSFQDFESTPKKPRTDDSYQIKDVPFESATKTTPRKSAKLRSKKQSFRKKLCSAPDLDTYFNVNNIENERSPGQQEHFSPIFDNARRGSRTPLSSSGSNLLRASTPKSSNKHFGYGTGGKYESKPPTSVKKLLTFSESQFDQLLRADQKEDLFTSSTVTTTPTDDTASRKSPSATTTSSTKKCLAESFVRAGESKSYIEKSHNLGGSMRLLSSDVNTSPSEMRLSRMFALTSTVLRDRDHSRQQLPRSSRPCGRVDTDSSTHNFITESLTCSKKEKTETESQRFHNENDMELSTSCMVSPGNSEPNSAIIANYDIKSNNDLLLNDSIICEPKSPSPPPQVVFSEPIASSSHIALPRTPKKQKSASLDHERLEILYPRIARTPSKHSLQRRRAACKRKSLATLSETFKRRKYYGGNTHLNIIAKLEPYRVIVDQILGYLSTHDLANMCEVSSSWRQAVQSNRCAWQKVKSYWSTCKSLKENKFYHKQLEGDLVKESHPVAATNNDIVIIPLKQNNNRIDRKRTSEQNRSPPVSPSKRKFHENQKVVRTLAPNEKLVKCPRCSQSSRIYNALTLNKDHHNNNSNKTIETSTNKSCHSRSLSATFHTLDYDITSSRNIQSLSAFSSSTIPASLPSSSSCLASATVSSLTRRNRFFEKSWSLDSAIVGGLYSQSSSLAEDDTSQYAECSRITCKYRFCLECLCDYHPGQKCMLYKSSSPSRDDGTNEFSQTPSTRINTRALRRKTLKRLCF